MSPTTDNFIHSLVEMSKAFETLPSVQQELERERETSKTYADQIQRLEMKLMERHAEIEALNAKVLATEVRADNAETMFLECDDKLSAFRRLAENFSGNIAGLVKAQEPVKAVEPKPVPVVILDPYHNEPPVANPSHDYDPPQGEREVDPIATHNTTTESPSVPPVATTDTVATAAEPSPGPYANKRYYDHPTYVPRHEWLAGGGSSFDYDWRPESNRAIF